MSKTLRHHIMIKQDLVTPQWDTTINLNFRPDEVIVREVVFAPADTDEGLFTVHTTLCNVGNNSGLCTFQTLRVDASNIYKSFNSCPNSVFVLPNFNNNSYNFIVKEFDGTTAELGGELVIHLEFVKYA